MYLCTLIAKINIAYYMHSYLHMQVHILIHTYMLNHMIIILHKIFINRQLIYALVPAYASVNLPFEVDAYA